VQSSVKLLNQKQIVHFEIQTNATNQKCDFLLREIFQLMSKPEEHSIENLCEHINNNKISEFQAKIFNLNEVKKNTIDNESLKNEIENTNLQISSQLQLNGNDFILGKENKKFDYSELRKKLLYLMIDQNVRNFFNLELIV